MLLRLHPLFHLQQPHHHLHQRRTNPSSGCGCFTCSDNSCCLAECALECEGFAAWEFTLCPLRSSSSCRTARQQEQWEQREEETQAEEAQQQEEELRLCKSRKRQQSSWKRPLMKGSWNSERLEIRYEDWKRCKLLGQPLHQQLCHIQLLNQM